MSDCYAMTFDASAESFLLASKSWRPSYTRKQKNYGTL
jgi:hypothetical protein